MTTAQGLQRRFQQVLAPAAPAPSTAPARETTETGTRPRAA